MKETKGNISTYLLAATFGIWGGEIVAKHAPYDLVADKPEASVGPGFPPAKAAVVDSLLCIAPPPAPAALATE